MADPSTKQREMASLYVFSAALKGQELNIPDHKHFDGAQGPERPALIDQGIRDIWTDTKISSGGLKMEDVFSYKHHFLSCYHEYQSCPGEIQNAILQVEKKPSRLVRQPYGPTRHSGHRMYSGVGAISRRSLRGLGGARVCALW